jgi:hypothetical protein
LVPRKADHVAASEMPLNIGQADAGGISKAEAV